MKTGEGKTLVATMPSYLNALTGGAFTWSRSTTIWPNVTRSGWGASTTSSAWMSAPSCRRWTRLIAAGPTRPTSPMAPTTSSASTICATTWLNLADCVQREHHYAIVDEVDSILIDEARTH